MPTINCTYVIVREDTTFSVRYVGYSAEGFPDALVGMLMPI